MYNIGTTVLAIATNFIIGLNFLTPCNLTSEQLENGLLYELKPLAETFVEIEEDYGINSALYASVVALESGWGQSYLSDTNNNVTSLMDASSPNRYKKYESKKDCLYDMAENLSENYLRQNSKYFGGSPAIDDVACYYLIGKPWNQMNAEEKQRTKEYSDTVKDIYSSILERAIQ